MQSYLKHCCWKGGSRQNWHRVWAEPASPSGPSCLCVVLFGMVWYGMEVAPSSDHFSSHHQPISAPKLSSNTYSSHILCILKQTLFMVFFISQPISSPQRTKVLHPSYTAPKRRKVNFVRRQIHFLDWSCFVFSPAPLPPNHASITSPAQIMASALQRRFSRKGAAGAQASLCLAALLRAQSERACFVSKQLNCSAQTLSQLFLLPLAMPQRVLAFQPALHACSSF